jgi:hypothetical protein
MIDVKLTEAQYYNALQQCKDIFIKKTKDYGTAWRVLRTISIVDQIYIKAFRIKTIQELKTQLVNDDIKDEWKGIVNYGIIGLIQLDKRNTNIEEIDPTIVENLYQEKVTLAFDLMQQKNHDYGEIWRSMSQESFTDLIIMKLQRMKQIIANEGKTLISEGIDANYLDIINYSLFALILLDQPQ